MGMNVWTRAAIDDDRAKFNWIEKGAIKGLAYVDDVWDLFTKFDDGEFTAAFLDDELGGFGKLTNIYGDYGWLEALRVHPDFQSKGLGKAIYVRYMEQMKEMGLSAVGMYTGYKNIISRGLAEKNGLSIKGRFSEYTKSNLNEYGNMNNDIYLVEENSGEAILSKYYDNMGNFAVVNRTFYPVGPGMGKAFARNEWLYSDKEGNVIVVGYRFQPERALHISFMWGDTEKLMKFASNMAIQIGSSSLSAIRPYDDKSQQDLLEGYGFIKGESDLITLWKGL